MGAKYPASFPKYTVRVFPTAILETKQNIAELGGPTKYMMWMEDVQSIAEKMKVIRAGQTAGVAEWKLTLEDPEVWPVISGS